MKYFKSITALFFFNLKKYLSPFKTLLKYPHISIFGRAIIRNSIISKHVNIYDMVTLNNVKIDKYTYVGTNSSLMNCSVGKYCSIAPNVKVGLGIHPIEFISTYAGFYSKKASGVEKIYGDPNVTEHKDVCIKNDVWIGYGAMILDGVTIGNGAVIAAGAIVTKDVPDYGIVGGIPAKLIKYRFSKEKINDLINLKWWDRDINYIRNKGYLFTNNTKFFKEFNND